IAQAKTDVNRRARAVTIAKAKIQAGKTPYWVMIIVGVLLAIAAVAALNQRRLMGKKTPSADNVTRAGEKNRNTNTGQQSNDNGMWIQDNEIAWKQTKESYEEDERKDNEYEKMLKTPKSNPSVEERRKAWLDHDLKELNRPRAARKKDFDLKRKVY